MNVVEKTRNRVLFNGIDAVEPHRRFPLPMPEGEMRDEMDAFRRDFGELIDRYPFLHVMCSVIHVQVSELREVRPVVFMETRNVETTSHFERMVQMSRQAFAILLNSRKDQT